MSSQLRDNFDYVVSCYVDWFRALKSPRRAAGKLLCCDSRDEQFSAITNLWFASFTLAATLSLPIGAPFGLRVENVSFQLITVVLQYAVFLGTFAVLHLSLRLYRVPSVAIQTLVIYSVLTVAVTPVGVLLSLPAQRHELLILSQVKAKHLSFTKALTTVVSSFSEGGHDASSILATFMQPLIELIMFVIVAMFAKMVAKQYEANIVVVVRAIAFALTVAMIPLVVTAIILQYTILYIFMM